MTQRLRQLQAWVDRMCKHPVVAHSDVFQHFLRCTEDKVTVSAGRLVTSSFSPLFVT